MPIFPNRTLDQKLSAMVSLVSGFVLVLAVMIFAGASVFGAREDLQDRLVAVSDAVAASSRLALAAADARAATQTLHALEADPQIMGATLVRLDGKVIAAYNSALFAEPSDRRERLFAALLAGVIDRHIEVVRPVVVNGETVAHVRVVADLADTWFQVERRLGIICALAGMAYLFMMFLARRARRTILCPVDRLVQAANEVSSANRYALRVEKETDDEIGALTDAFNRMLAQIEARDAQLEAARTELEKRVETRTAELQSANEQLHLEVAERRAAEAAQMAAKDTAEAAERASRAKSQFLANMSREIRTPMSSVQGMVELLLATELSSRQRHYAESVQRSGEALLDVFNGILDFSKVEAGRMEIEAVEFDCRETLADVARLLSERAARKGLGLTCRCERDVPHAVVGDPSRLKQILLNLVGNAIKFTARGDVRMRLGIAARQGDTFVLRFEVQDTGVGIARDAHQTIFEAFSQIDGAAAGEHGGSGLGLAVAKQLTQLMGGEIGVESMPGRGSTFWFTVRVPKAPGDLASGSSDAAAEDTATRRFCGRVLVAEDDPDNREVAVAMLEAVGIEVTTAHNGREAVYAVTSGGIDLVLMDCQMPEMDGYSAARAIRETQHNDAWRVPIVALTASALDGDRARCLAAGMDDYLSKPFKPAQLLSVLARWLPEADQVNSEATDEEHPQYPAAAVTTLEIGAIDQIRSLGGGEADKLLDKIVGLYCDSVPQMLISMQEAARKGDCVQLQRAAHALKTSSHNVGAMRLAQLCRDLESAARGGTILFDRLATLEFEFNSVQSKLKRVA